MAFLGNCWGGETESSSSRKNVSDIFVYAGSIYLSKGGKNHTVEKVIIHEMYDEDSQWKNDICLVKLEKGFVIKDNIQQVLLAPQDWPIYSGDKVTITGWGRTKPVSAWIRRIGSVCYGVLSDRWAADTSRTRSRKEQTTPLSHRRNAINWWDWRCFPGISAPSATAPSSPRGKWVGSESLWIFQTGNGFSSAGRFRRSPREGRRPGGTHFLRISALRRRQAHRLCSRHPLR